MKATFAFATAFSIFASIASAEAPKWGDDLSKTIGQARRENKLGFILVGREGCGNCKATKALVEQGKIPVTADTFVAADINIDDQKSEAEFRRKYKKLEFGSTLPFVVVTDSSGKALAHAGGFKGAEHWTKVIEEAKAKTAAVKK